MYWCYSQVLETSLSRLLCHILYISSTSGTLFILMCILLFLLFIHPFLYSFKHVIINLLKSLSANCKSGTSVNLFYCLIFGKFPFIFTWVVISNCTLSFMCKPTIDAIWSFLPERLSLSSVRIFCDHLHPVTNWAVYRTSLVLVLL